MHSVLSLILGGGRGAQLYPLTKYRSKAAVPLAGKYRFIDIPISNCLNSGLNRIYVLTQYLSVSLHRHIANTFKFDQFNQGFVEVLAAQVTNEAADWYQGSADAVRRNMQYLAETDTRDILILSDDQLYRMDFRLLLEAHRQTRADVTLAVLPVTRLQAGGLGIVRPDETGRVMAFEEKPQSEAQLNLLRLPPGWLERRGIAHSKEADFLGSMGIYLFTREALLDLLTMQPPGNDFANELFPRCLRSHKMQTYVFQGYWEHLETIEAYHAASLALASDHPPFDFHSPEGIIYTRMRNLPASRISEARLEQALVSDGCVVGAGTRIERCLLGVRSRIGRNVTLRDAVLLGANYYEIEPATKGGASADRPAIGVGDNSVLERIIVDKNCRIGRNVHIVNRLRVQEADNENYTIRNGIVVLPNEAVIPDGTVI
jgi:glucose-1-phosphate adenylyltransferase